MSHLDSSQDLIHEVAVVGIPQSLLGLIDDVVKIAVEQLHHDVKLVVVLANEQVFEGNDVLVGSQVSG